MFLAHASGFHLRLNQLTYQVSVLLKQHDCLLINWDHLLINWDGTRCICRGATTSISPRLKVWGNIPYQKPSRGATASVDRPVVLNHSRFPTCAQDSSEPWCR